MDSINYNASGQSLIYRDFPSTMAREQDDCIFERLSPFPVNGAAT